MIHNGHWEQNLTEVRLYNHQPCSNRSFSEAAKRLKPIALALQFGGGLVMVCT